VTARRSQSRRPGGNGSYIVATKKHSGGFVEFGRYDDEAEARKVCRLLAWAGALPQLSGPNGELPLDRDAP
jgi:hypothetical protein